MTIEPACGVAAVCTAQAVEPNSETTTPPMAAAAKTLPRATRGPSKITAAVTTAPTVMTGRSHAFQPGARASNADDQNAVTRTAAAPTARAKSDWRCCHSRCAPMPTIAAIAGASATV